jgi:excisionase family DNA binding protein
VTLRVNSCPRRLCTQTVFGYKNMTTNATNNSEAIQPSIEAVLTVADAARYLRISESVVRRLIRERRIPFFRIDGRYLLFRPVLEDWMRSISVVPVINRTSQEAKGLAEELIAKGGQ